MRPVTLGEKTLITANMAVAVVTAVLTRKLFGLLSLLVLFVLNLWLVVCKTARHNMIKAYMNHIIMIQALKMQEYLLIILYDFIICTFTVTVCFVLLHMHTILHRKTRKRRIKITIMCCFYLERHGDDNT